MPAACRLGDNTNGHGCFAPTPISATPVTKTFINGILASVIGADLPDHVCGRVTHRNKGFFWIWHRVYRRQGRYKGRRFDKLWGYDGSGQRQYVFWWINITMATRNTRQFTDLNLMFTKHPATADVTKKIDEEAVKSSIRNLISTKNYERPFHPEIGCQIYSLLFENFNPITVQVMKRTIFQVIEKYEPRLRF